MMNLLVIDLSHWDEAHDYAAVKESGVAGVIYKATQGSGYVDDTYADQRALAVAQGLLWGAYHFGDGSSPADQAQNFLHNASILAGDLFCLDYEDNPDSQMSIGQAKSWVNMVENSLVRENQTVLYSGNTIKETMRPQDHSFWISRRLWIAQYGPSADIPAPWKKYWLWQYTDNATIPGVGKGIDGNHFDGSPEQLKEEWASGKSILQTPQGHCPTCGRPWRA